jgi:hypothetical protein
MKQGVWSRWGAGIAMMVVGVACSSGEHVMAPVDEEAQASLEAQDVSPAADAGVCGHIPTLHPEGAGPYCPFLQPKGAACAVHQHCCYPAATMAVPKPPTTCAAACPAMQAADFACDSAAQCGASQVCCGKGTVEQDMNPMCGFFGKQFDGTYCAAAATGCKATETHICAKDADCAAGKKCVAFATKGKDLGFCQ